MNEETGVEYLKPWQVNEVIYGLGGIGIIEKIPEKYTQSPRLAVGDIVMDKSLNWPWQTYFLVNPDNLEKVPEACLGQIMSECIYEIIDFPKYHWKFLIDFSPGRFY